MRLKKVKVKNFRSLRETEWIMCHDLTAFIGENDGGKTACTMAIRLLFDDSVRPEEGDYTWQYNDLDNSCCRAQKITIEAILEVKDSEKASIKELLGEEYSEIHIIKRFNISGTRELKMKCKVPEIEDLRVDFNQKTVQELKNLAKKHNIDISGASLKAEIVAKIQNWVNKHPKVIGEMDLPEEMKQFLPKVEVFESSNVIDPEQIVNNTLRLLCKNEIESGKYKGEIGAIEDGITESLREKVFELAPYIKKYYSEVDEVDIDPQFNITSGLNPVPLKLIKEGEGPIELQRKGDGRKRQVALGIYEWSTETLNKEEISGDIILIMDEPDTHMDYRSQRKLFDIISSYVCNQIQVMICTHSLNLINRMPVDKINHCFLNEEGYTIFENLEFGEDDETETLFIDEIGLSLGLDTGTIFHERCFLIVEGPTEVHCLPRLFKLIHGKSLQSSGVKLINGENNGGVRNFAKFLNDNNRKVIFILDTDCTTGPSKRIFSKENLIKDGFNIDEQVFFVGETELEDAFKNEILVKVGNNFYPKDDGSLWVIDDFEEIRGEGKFSESLQRLFRCNKPDIGYNISKTIDNVDDIPECIHKALSKAYEFANV